MKGTISSTVILLLFVSGCSNNMPAVTGTVTFEDGTPLTKGVVVFRGDKVSYRGELNDSGEFSLKGGGDEVGCAPGDYKVFIEGAFEDEPEETGEDAGHSEGEDGGGSKPLIALKFMNPDESGFKETVSASGGEFTYKVTKPGPEDLANKE